MSEESLMLDPNTAGIDELISLPGVGEVLAERIVEARPFRDAEDMLRVSGLGPSLLSRLTPFLVFEESSKPEELEDQPDEAVSDDVAPAEPIQKPKVVPVTREGPSYSRGTTLWLVVGMGVISIALSVIISLAILGGINRTLNYGQHASVRSLVDDTTLLQAELEGLASRLEAIDRRVEAMEGLSRRVMTVENEFQALQQEVSGSLEAMNSVQMQIEKLSGEVGALSERVGVFDAFLDGLRQLLLADAPMEP